MERRPPPVPHWWCLTFNNLDLRLTEKGRSEVQASLETQGIQIHWNAATRIWIVVSSVEAAMTCWILGNGELIGTFAIKVKSYTPDDKESKAWVKEHSRTLDPYLI